LGIMVREHPGWWEGMEVRGYYFDVI